MREIIEFNYLDVGKDALNHIYHSHGRSYEIIYVKSGSGVFLIDGKILPLEAGAFYLINGICTHCSVPRDPDKYHRRKLVIAADFVDNVLALTGDKKLTEKLFEEGGSLYLPIDEYAREIDSIFLSIHKTLNEKNDFKYSYILSYVLRLFFIANECGESNDQTESNEMTKILSFLSTNFRKRLSLDEISNAVNISRYYLCHRFKEKLGMTIFEYINFRRLSYAKDRLINTDLPISQISDEAGFSDFSYFSKIFREFEGITPSAFRKIR